jgi:hypothetical protein
MFAIKRAIDERDEVIEAYRLLVGTLRAAYEIEKKRRMAAEDALNKLRGNLQMADLTPTDHQMFIWIRSWEDTFTAAGRTIEECHEWLRGRLKKWGIAWLT